MNELMTRLEIISDQCMDPKKKKQKEEEEKAMDDFQRLKKKIAEEVKDIRHRIEERNELLSKNENNPTSVRMSSEIRTKIKELKKKSEELDRIQKQHAEAIEKRKRKGKNVPKEEEEQAKLRAEIVDLCRKHIEECQFLEKEPTGRRSGLISGGGATPNAPTSLPDLDDERFAQLRAVDKQLDDKLDIVHEGVQTLKQMATEIDKEVELQSTMIDDLDTHVTKTSASLNSLNKRLKDQLKNVRSCDRFILDFICVILILGVAAAIYNLVS